MGAVIVLMGIIGFAVLFTYLKFPPPYAKKSLVRTFDMMVLGVCALLCAVWALKSRVEFGGESFGYVFAALGALGIEIVFLGIFFLVRNFWVFKARRQGGRSGFFK